MTLRVMQSDDEQGLSYKYLHIPVINGSSDTMHSMIASLSNNYSCSIHTVPVNRQSLIEMQPLVP